MKKPYTDPIYIGEGATERLYDFLRERFGDCADQGITVCDENTERFCYNLPPIMRVVYGDGVHATDINASEIADAAADCESAFGYRPSYLIACGSGSVHDLTRYAAHDMGIPFISYPTAPSMDGFVSAIAAMTIDGRKVSYPSTPPIALFADPDVFCTSPARLTASGVGDIVGKYISILDWKVADILGVDRMDSEICALVEEALDTVMKMSPNDEGYTEKVLRCLVLSGLSIQYYGSSRPASGSEHHLSHLWEMHCMNSPTDALHGEQVGVSTLLVLEKYKSLLNSGIRFVSKRDRVCTDYLKGVYGDITEGIIEENTPYPLDGVDGELSPEAETKIRELIEGLPSVEFIRDYLKSVGAKTTLSELGLPDSDDFAQKSLEFAPYARRRLTLLKLI